MTLLYTDERFLKHQTGQHVERPERLQAITRRLENSGLAARCKKAECRPFSEDAVAGVHDWTQIMKVRQVSEHGGGHLDPDTVLSADSFSVALLAAGTAATAVDAVLKGSEHTALCLVRPPGHHATQNH